MTNCVSNAATAATSTLVSSTASTEVTDLLKAGQKKTAEFVLVLSGISLMSETVTLSGVTDESKFTGNIKDDVAGSRIKVSTKASLFSEPIALLKGIKKKAEAVLNKYGIKAGIDGGYFIPKDVVVSCLEEIIPLRDEFNDTIAQMEKTFSDYTSAEQVRCNQIEDIELRKEALGKIPTFEKFNSKCSFKPIVLDWAQTTDATVNTFLSESKTEKSTSIVEDYFNKVFEPFATVKYDYDNNVKNKGDAYKADEVGKKRGSIRKACQKSLDTKFCMELVFKDEPEKSILEKVYNVIETINSRFADGTMAKPSEGLQKVMIEIYHNILSRLNSRTSFQKFLDDEGGDIEIILKGFDVAKAKKGALETELDFSSKEENLKAIDDVLTELAELCQETNQTEEVKTISEDNSEEKVETDAELQPEELVTAETEEILSEDATSETDNSVTEISNVEESPALTIDPESMEVEDYYRSLGL